MKFRLLIIRIFNRRPEGGGGEEISLNFAEGKINFKRYEETIAKVCISGFLTA